MEKHSLKDLSFSVVPVQKTYVRSLHSQINKIPLSTHRLLQKHLLQLEVNIKSQLLECIIVAITMCKLLYQGHRGLKFPAFYQKPLSCEPISAVVLTSFLQNGHNNHRERALKGKTM